MNPTFCALSNDDPALGFSPLVRALSRTLDYLNEHGSIGLTPSGALKRKFVEWAATAFDWPGHQPEDLYAVNKVLNEHDFYPLVEVHDLMLDLKLGRHFKGEFRLTRQGKALVGKPEEIFALIAPHFLFRVNHERHARVPPEYILMNCDVLLNVINVELDGGATGAHLREALFGPPPAPYRDEIMSALYMQVLRPLCWLGLLAKLDKEFH